MYQRALQGYGNAMGHEAVKIYILAPNTLENLAALCGQLGINSASEDAKTVFGHGSGRYGRIAAALDTLLNGE
jgi:hypothetical protein